jgi:hypothetical protein
MVINDCLNEDRFIVEKSQFCTLLKYEKLKVEKKNRNLK